MKFGEGVFLSQDRGESKKNQKPTKPPNRSEGHPESSPKHVLGSAEGNHGKKNKKRMKIRRNRGISAHKTKKVCAG